MDGSQPRIKSAQEEHGDSKSEALPLSFCQVEGSPIMKKYRIRITTSISVQWRGGGAGVNDTFNQGNWNVNTSQVYTSLANRTMLFFPTAQQIRSVNLQSTCFSKHICLQLEVYISTRLGWPHEKMMT